MTYAIYEDFYADVEKKLNKIAKKCTKYGNDFIFEIKGEEIREKYNKELDRTEYYKFILVEVEGTARINDWECIAVLEIHKDGNIIRRINTNIDMPKRFENSEDICEHCNSKRHRNNLYVIHNVVTDEWKQVGGNCLKLYTNGLNMEYVTAYMDGITELEEHSEVFRAGGKAYFTVEEILSYAVEIINKLGYFNTQSSLPTKSLVTYLAYNHRDKAIEEINRELTLIKSAIRFDDKDFSKTDTESTVEKIIEYYKGLDADSEFIHNIQLILNEGYVSVNNFGFLCYLPQGYKKYIEKEIEKAEKEEANAESKYFGEIGIRYKDKVIKDVVCITKYQTQWGINSIYKITIEDDATLFWKTNKYIDNEKSFDKISFTVKAHNEYKGEKQTEITRCTVSVK